MYLNVLFIVKIDNFIEIWSVFVCVYHLMWTGFLLKSSECMAVARAAYRWEWLNLRQYTGLVTESELNWKNCTTNKKETNYSSIKFIVSHLEKFTQLCWKHARYLIHFILTRFHPEDILYTPAGTPSAVCPRGEQHRSTRSRWLSCDFRLSGYSTERCHEAPPTPSHTSCWEGGGVYTHLRWAFLIVFYSFLVNPTHFLFKCT